MGKQWISILIVGLTFGTSWAIRGQFGHEEGAAWAAAIGAMALVLAARRKDWYPRILTVALSSALGWGAGGMISYGKVVGYGRSIDLGPAWYGIFMLFVIGSLFGLLGGGLTGLSLWSAGKKRVNWAALLTEMTAGGVIFYHLLVAQMEILMTPPRSEAWAVCLGAGAAMLWHMARNDLRVPLRVAFITALGGGFGFAFGNFLQVTGNVMNIDFNMWNVMEYSIGFFGGSALAYSVFTSEWPQETAEPQKWESLSAWSVIFVFIPVMVFVNSNIYEFLKAGSPSVPDSNVNLAGSLFSLAVLLSVIIIPLLILKKASEKQKRKYPVIFFLVLFIAYIFLSYTVTGAFTGKFHLNHHLYVLNLIVVLFLMAREYPAFIEPGTGVLRINGIRWFFLLLLLTALTFIMALILVNMHGELNGAANRFSDTLNK